MRILVLVLSYAREPWRTIELAGQRATWAADDIADVPVRFYYGLTDGPVYWSSKIGSKALRSIRARGLHSRFEHHVGRWTARRPVERAGDRFLTRVPESYVNTNAKLRATLRYLLVQERFDFLLRTNTTSYVERRRLRSLVSALPRSGYFGGFVGQKHGVPYAMGTGILISRDVVEAAAADPHWEFDLVDDVAFGHSMRRVGIEPQFIPRIELSSPDEDLDAGQLDECYLVRCLPFASGTKKRTQSEAERGVRLMRHVHLAYEAIPLGC
jgi:hypothetical protein